MPDQSILCPKCGTKIELTAAITSQIEEKLQAQFDSRAKQREKEFEKALAAKDKEADEKLAEAREKLEVQARKRATDSVAVELKDLRQQLADREKQVEIAQNQELELRKKQRDLEQREKNQELEMARKLDDERKKIWQEAAAKSDEQNQLKLREKDLLMEQLQKQIEVLNKKVEQGPQQRQGEVQELELEDRLRAQFPLDEIEPVAKGKKGGDVLQRVRDRLGHDAGAILWESKRTRNWSDTWIPKLKDDQRDAKADVAVIVTEVLPKDVAHSGQVDGVWVTDFQFALGLGMALREALVQVAQARNALSGRTEKMQVVYDYLSGQQFKQRVEAIVESFKSMKEDLETEKRSMERQWAKREKQIEGVIKNTAGMYGDLQGIIGASLPSVKILELPGA
jgi:hypothetical protein